MFSSSSATRTLLISAEGAVTAGQAYSERSFETDSSRGRRSAAPINRPGRTRHGRRAPGNWRHDRRRRGRRKRWGRRGASWPLDPRDVEVGGVGVGLDRQEHGERRPLSGLRADLDRSAVVLDDALTDGKPEPRSIVLGGEKRNEQILDIARRNAHTRVAKAHLEESRRGPAPGRTPQAGRDQQLARQLTRRHGLERVEREVQKHLQELLRVGAHGWHSFGEARGDLDRPLELPRGQQRERLLEHLGDIERTLLAAVGPRVIEELRPDLVQPIHLLDDDVQELAGALAGPFSRTLSCQSGLQELRGPFDRYEWIPDLVCQASRHLTERRQTIALLHTLVDLRVLQGDADAVGHPPKELDLVGRIRLPQPI